MPTATLPERFGRYRILKRLGQGAMGAVYLAEDTQLGRRVAVKVPHIAADDGPNVLERFYREARAAATLHHANLCPVYDVGSHDGIAYLTMAYIDGQTLAASLKNGKPMPQRAAARIVRTIAEALHEAHQRGVIHRDLKPSNVMLNEHGEPVVMDFGIARVADASAERITGSGALIGTPSYMSPEQARGDLEAMGPGCDIYSLGVILYELVTGQLPFEGPVAVVLAQILTQTPPRPSVYRVDVDPQLEAICLKAMHKDISARYASMIDFAWALGEFQQPKALPVAVAAPARPVGGRGVADTRPDTAAPAKANTVRGTAARSTLPRRVSEEATVPERRSSGAGLVLGCAVGAVAGCAVALAAVLAALLFWPDFRHTDVAREEIKQALQKDIEMQDAPVNADKDESYKPDVKKDGDAGTDKPVTGGPGFGVKQDDKDKKEQAAKVDELDGTWASFLDAKSGKKTPKDGLDTLFVFKDGRYITRIAGNVVESGTYKADASKRPAALDLLVSFSEKKGVFKGKTVLGIYKVQGDLLTLALALPGSGPGSGIRPEFFNGWTNTMTLKRHNGMKDAK